ncbi:uncharacterized protein JCM6883_007365 [Sporobolomyces salmoneus]|uniref:uncharacterized protein n=1 Tax=Sporobolomyces salmoneus TaxID=183962 RepID=UPI003181F069
MARKVRSSSSEMKNDNDLIDQPFPPLHQKPTSGKARKAQLQHKRAVKQANQQPVPFPADAANASTKPSPAQLVTGGGRNAQTRSAHRTSEQRARDEIHGSRMALESRFIRLPKEVQDVNRMKAATEILERPIGEEMGVLRVEEMQPEGGEELTCPKRPKWSYNSTKKEVEKNEEGMFRKWLTETDETLAKLSSSQRDRDQDDDYSDLPTTMNSSPTFYERNLNVWRQLWRTTEISEILLVLIDVRFPLLHYPPSLRNYLNSQKPRKPRILILTKCDLVPRWLSEAWKTWLEETEDESVSVVMMESYREEERGQDTQGTQPRFIPSAPPPARHALLTALRAAHSSLLAPPAVVAEDPEKLARWSPRLRKEVDWDSIEEEGVSTGAHAGEEGYDGKQRRRKKEEREFIVRQDKKRQEEGEGEETEEEAEEEQEEEPKPEEQREEKKGDDAYPFLTVGLIGSPNCGKSSLLNALIGRKIVRASRTPGKTKTLQTIYWNPHIRLCDCPGLVPPSSAGLERQVLAGVLPIQNIEPTLRFIGQRIPLEKVLKLKHEDEVEEEQKQDEFSLEVSPPKKEEKGRWTTDELLSAYADQQGFITAKVGRPDIYRAGAFILRQLHSSSIPWGFRPPFAGDAASQGSETQEGIWLKDFKPKAGSGWVDYETRERESDEERSGDEDVSGSEEEKEESGEEEEDSADEKAVKAIKSVFSALAVEGEDEDSEEEYSEEDGDAEESGDEH